MLVERNAAHFCGLILYQAAVLNAIIWSNNVYLDFGGFFFKKMTLSSAHNAGFLFTFGSLSYVLMLECSTGLFRKLSGVPVCGGTSQSPVRQSSSGGIISLG